jgi:DNA-binding IclR family transcriptional regulator
MVEKFDWLDTEKRWWSLTEIADALGVSRMTLHRWICKVTIPGYHRHRHSQRTSVEASPLEIRQWWRSLYRKGVFTRCRKPTFSG